MRHYLLFRLYGPMASWGDIAVGEYRPSFAYPSKSAILGLLAAAVGIRREAEDSHCELTSAYLFAVRVDTMGILQRDYHTTQVPSGGTGKKKKAFPTRRDELETPKEDLNTILSSRDYRCDTLYTICLWATNESPPYSLEILAEKLRRPAFTLYLGRKSCPLALPAQPIIVEANSIRHAFEKATFRDIECFTVILSGKDNMVYWEGTGDSGYPRLHTITRRDTPLSRRRWQFADREEHYGAGTSNNPEG